MQEPAHFGPETSAGDLQREPGGRCAALVIEDDILGSAVRVRFVVVDSICRTLDSQATIITILYAYMCCSNLQRVLLELCISPSVT